MNWITCPECEEIEGDIVMCDTHLARKAAVVRNRRESQFKQGVPVTPTDINEAIQERLAAMTAADHVVASYEAYTRNGVHLAEDRNFYFKKAAVATAKYLGRPLTAEEITEASERAT